MKLKTNTDTTKVNRLGLSSSNLNKKIRDQNGRVVYLDKKSKMWSPEFQNTKPGAEKTNNGNVRGKLGMSRGMSFL